jgi:5'-3' exonuclease
MSKSFSELDYNIPEEGNNLMIVDGLNLAFRYKHANKKVFSLEYLTTVKSLAKSYEAKDVIVLGDGGSSYRKAIFSGYKGDREERRAKQTEEEAQDFIDFLEEFNRSLELLNRYYKTFKFIGVEADDIAAYLVKILEYKYEHIWLISSDKDWDLLISENVSRFSYRTRKEITKENWSEHYPYNLEDHISIKVLMGDKGDTVPGVDGIGEKRAHTIIKEYGPTAFDIYDALPIESKYKYIQNLNNFKEQLLINYQLMDLRTYAEEAIGKENIEIIKNELFEN